ncbi:TetR/AcrR family transcriptional regulator [Bacillus sp. DJP31]|uniref:TetR/AcrR family transcriptional regulator n=1 Tax=Bacillus sp. DJP31 TaxID=3409789 RepID=UPI003BB63C90
MSEQGWIQELLRVEKNEDVKFSEKQLKIVEAAIDIFSEKGFAATSTSEIAKKAGVAEGTIFRHYKTKKDLLFSIVRPTIEKLLAPHFAKSFAKDVFETEYNSYEEFVKALATNRYKFLKGHFPIVKIFVQEIAFHEELRGPYIQLFKEHIYKHFKKIVIQFQQKGELIDLPPDTIIRLTISTIMGMLVVIHFPLTDDDFETELERSIAFIMKGLSTK